MLSKNSESHKTRSRSLSKPEAGRFWGKVRRAGDDDCWIWQGALFTRGYGQFSLNGRPDGAHRVAWMLTHGDIPDGLFVLHRCDVRPCCNPAHLFLGTHKHNMEDAQAKGTLHVPRPGKQTVTDEQCAEMLALYRAGMQQNHIAQRFGVSRTYVCLLVKGLRRQYSDLGAAQKQRSA